jgi:hypothetical protein
VYLCQGFVLIQGQCLHKTTPHPPLEGAREGGALVQAGTARGLGQLGCTSRGGCGADLATPEVHACAPHTLCAGRCSLLWRVHEVVAVWGTHADLAACASHCVCGVLPLRVPGLHCTVLCSWCTCLLTAVLLLLLLSAGCTRSRAGRCSRLVFLRCTATWRASAGRQTCTCAPALHRSARSCRWVGVVCVGCRVQFGCVGCLGRTPGANWLYLCLRRCVSGLDMCGCCCGVTCCGVLSLVKELPAIRLACLAHPQGGMLLNIISIAC